VDCNHAEKHYVMSTKTSSVAFGNPAIPEAQPHLQIDGKLVCQNVLPLLYNALSSPDYSKYLKKKLHWTHGNLLNIHWNVLS